MSFTVREANPEEIAWIKVQLNPAAYYLDMFLATKKQFGAIDVDTYGKATRLKGVLNKEIKTRGLSMEALTRKDVATVLLRNDGTGERADE